MRKWEHRGIQWLVQRHASSMSTGILTQAIWCHSHFNPCTHLQLFSFLLSLHNEISPFHHSHFVWHITGRWSPKVWKPLTWYSDFLYCTPCFGRVSYRVSREILAQGWIWGSALGWGMPTGKDALTREGGEAGAWGPDSFLPLPGWVPVEYEWSSFPVPITFLPLPRCVGRRDWEGAGGSRPRKHLLWD